MFAGATALKLLIRGGVVLTLGERTSNHDEADVLIEDGRVVDIARTIRARDAEVVDAGDAVVMPGFVDAHRHAWRTLLRQTGGVDPARARQLVSDAGPSLTPDDVYAATMLSLLNAAQYGITTVVDVADVQADHTFAEATLQAHVDAGVRTALVHTAPGWRDHAAALESLERLATADASSVPARVRLAYGYPGANLDGDVPPEDAWPRARALGLRVHAHAGLDEADRGVVARLGAAGLLGDDVTLAHCCALADDDLDALARHNVGVAITPSSEMALSLGSPPLQALLDRKIRPGLGTDDATIAPGDGFAPMRAAQSLQHARVFDLKLAGKASLPDMMTTRDVIRYATSAGARAIGMADVAGSVEVGRPADLIVLRTDAVNISPVNDPIGAVVWGMDPSNIDTVIVDGQPLVRDGALIADITDLRARVDAAVARLERAVGPMVGAGDGGGR